MGRCGLDGGFRLKATSLNLAQAKALRRVTRRRAKMARNRDGHGFWAGTLAALRRAVGVGVWDGAPLAKRDIRSLVAAGFTVAEAKATTWVSRW